MNIKIINTLIVLLLLASNLSVFSQSTEVRKKQYNVKKGIGIQGYDPVSYFSGKPTQGNSEISAAYKGITYYFTNTANKAKFEAAPNKYEPQYGGWCAYAIGETGDKVKIDPNTFKIIDNKLYLFYNFRGTNTLTSWNENQTVLKEQGDKNWAKIIK